MATLYDISISLIEGRKDTYHKEFIPALAQALKPGSTQADGEYLQECPDFDVRDALTVSERHPGLLVELDVKGEYEEYSCRVRLRGKDFETVEKQYPPFTSLLSTKESLLADRTFPLNIDLQKADQRALDFLRRHLSKPITVNDDLPGTEIDMTFRAERFLYGTMTLLLKKINKVDGKIVFFGIDQATGNPDSAKEDSVVPGQAVWAVNRLHQENYI